MTEMGSVRKTLPMSTPRSLRFMDGWILIGNELVSGRKHLVHNTS